MEERETEPHNIVGADVANKMLNQMNCEADKIDGIKNCIIKHNGEADLNNLTKEEWCVRNADILSMLNNLTIFYYLAYSEYHLNYKDGKEFVKEMVTSKYSKLDSRLKEEYQEYFEILLRSV